MHQESYFTFKVLKNSEENVLSSETHNILGKTPVHRMTAQHVNQWDLKTSHWWWSPALMVPGIKHSWNQTVTICHEQNVNGNTNPQGKSR